MQVKLRLLPAEQLHPHEETIPRKLKELTDQIASDTLVKHPLIVEDRDFIILDGMHRYAALTNLGCTMIPVALVDYSNPRIIIGRWTRLVDADEKLHLVFDAVTPPLQVHNLSLREVGSDSFAESLMEEKSAFTKLTLRNRIYFVEGTPSNTVEAYELLREIQEALEKEDFEISLHTEAEARKLLEADDRHCTLEGPKNKKEDVRNAVTSNHMFPPKATRHILPLRVFSIDVPLEKLRPKATDHETANQAFLKMLELRERRILPAGQTFDGRFYDEELIIFQ